ncbi:MAG: glutathione S-transferase N-terminal domain-containing protein [Candidatus Nanohaloarchaea archaeon]|nr:glutathione S-transferase N-terminal domain-containing protein [Candidatus Nanohaloarchaea archaeon]
MKLELYQFEGCPFCSKVRATMTDLGLSFVAHNPRQNEEKMEELLELGGEDQVPFLVVRDEDGDVVETLYESDDIIAYLEENFS